MTIKNKYKLVIKLGMKTVAPLVIAKKTGLSKQEISVILCRARQAGIAVPYAFSHLKQAISEIKNKK